MTKNISAIATGVCMAMSLLYSLFDRYDKANNWLLWAIFNYLGFLL